MSSPHNLPPGVALRQSVFGSTTHSRIPCKLSGLTIGGITYTAAHLLTILNNNGGNAVVILGRQLVGALLNLAAGGVHNSGADAAIASAQTLLHGQ